MPNPNHIYDFLLTQGSAVRDDLPFDQLETIIEECVQTVKKQNINARIANVVFNINDQLVPAQVYVERQNAFATTKENPFGASPTAYRIQVRFPFGLETILGTEKITLPSGRFVDTLPTYLSKNSIERTVCDDVQRDYLPTDILCDPAGIKKDRTDTKEGLTDTKKGPTVIKEIDDKKKTVTLRIPQGESISFSYSDEKGQRYHLLPLLHNNKRYYIYEYYDQHQYELHLKKAGVYPLFYFDHTEQKEEKSILRRHKLYPGYPSEPEENYKGFIDSMENEVLKSPAGQRWQRAVVQQQTQPQGYILNLVRLNGTTLFEESGLKLVRLRNYQLELYRNCLSFIERAKTASPKESKLRAGKINMGVGAGKTFSTFTLLQELQYEMQRPETKPTSMAPPFCMAPDEDIANVTKQSINKQGVTTGKSAIAITKKDHMPTDAFLATYQSLSDQAQQDAKKIDDYLDHGLQNEILQFCNGHSLHPNTVLNFLAPDPESKINLDKFKDSVDIKHLLLMVEGQKKLMEKAGMAGIDALHSLLRQFETMTAAVKKDPFFPKVKGTAEGKEEKKEEKEAPDPRPLIIQYKSITTTIRDRSYTYDLTNLQISQLGEILTVKYAQNYRTIRDCLLRLACLANKDAAVIFANSGGLGNTYSDAELIRQIAYFKPIALKQLTQMANKKNHTWNDHYTMYVYLNELFAKVPSNVNYKEQAERQNITRQSLRDVIYNKSMEHHVKLLNHVTHQIKAKIQALNTVKSSTKDNKSLAPFGIKPEDNAIRATNQLTGIAALRITGHALNDNAKLLLTHVPVFTPEGLACYFEYLDSLIKKPKQNFTAKHGVYHCVDDKHIVTSQDVAARVQQILNSVMLADEVHKDEFRFLFDTHNTIYQRINKIVKQYLKQEFIDVLPIRIGMSGTCNEITDRAFGQTSLYDLSIQKMIAQGIVKKINVVSQPLAAPPEDEKKNTNAYVTQIIVDYFTGANTVLDLFKVSKGLIFSKAPDQKLNQEIVRCFNLLIQEGPQGDDKTLQDELFAKINEKRREKITQLRKQTGKAPEKKSLKKEEDETEKASDVPLSPALLKTLHRDAFENNLFALYLEYILSKSNAPRELSDIVGIQNKFHQKGLGLIQGIHRKKKLCALIKEVDPTVITEQDAALFINARIKDKELQTAMLHAFCQAKNDPGAFVTSLRTHTAGIVLDQLVTDQRDEFESGKAFAMLGGKSEQTGYSHEPVGIVMDLPTNLANQAAVNDYFARLNELKVEEIQPFLQCLQTLAKETFSYDEKNQIGGRALRTPHGHVQYVQYPTQLSALLREKKLPPAHPLRAFKVETSFDDIFTEGETAEATAREERASITFNCKALSLLEEKNTATLEGFNREIRKHFAGPLSQTGPLQQQYENYIQHRVPLLWAMKYDDALAQRYFLNPEADVFAECRKKLIVIIFDEVPLLSFGSPVQPHNDEKEKGPPQKTSQNHDKAIEGPSVPPPPTKSNIIDEIYANICTLTDNYLNDLNDILKNEDSKEDKNLNPKYEDFKELKTILQDTQTHPNKIDRINAFQTKLFEFNNALSTTHKSLTAHRSTWKRYFYNVISLFPLLLLGRTIHSKVTYGTWQFWKPNSEKSIIGLVSEVKKLQPG